ncbi:uncharacterized protein LOC144915959 isoform X2 [Branchiostoma floridae x Branchiostoma belcheri]
MSDKKKVQTAMPRPARGIPRPTRGLPRPTTQTGTGRGTGVKIAFGRRILSSKTKPRQDGEETEAGTDTSTKDLATPRPSQIQKPAGSHKTLAMTVTKDKTVKRLRSSGSSSKEDSPAAVHGAKKANIEEEKLTGTITKNSYKLRSKTKNQHLNGICTTNFNPKATLTFTEFGGLTGKKSIPKQTAGLEKENVVLREQLKATKEELRVARVELEAAKASHEKAIDAGKLEENQQLKRSLEMCEKKLISLDINPVSLNTWFDLKEARDKQRRDTTARARAMLEKWKHDNEQMLETNKALLELKEKLQKMG